MWDWDETKRQATFLTRSLDFALVEDFDLNTAQIDRDDRRDYGEVRLKAIGMIRGRLFVIVFTPRDTGFRLISLRKANEREKREWARR
ncbi:MAG: BrnT family toxin [Pseudomonadota bacterium]